ncbi:phosphatidylinositol mannoside acyltransferase [Phytoactinopolyspora halotolerans]|uniref:Phosphatidylinositol mannoside acyltransferase n=1 Tax=Phytoactinopolyspora halotolerans TaxID=1981512 RepID=A0A6L9SF40_9ACTN|nr:phosphatidylinositol mannoside acyltransferase [Phytoactinopolyspora halotolerans]NEE03208.1 phosphatidylinositol mannoside acyltransferase [Phytoactinopolyspora halotolerans]
MTSLRDRRQLWMYSTGWAIVRAMPERAAYAAFRTIADVAWRRRAPSVQRLERNLARIVHGGEEELRTVSKAAARSYMRYWCDAFRIGDWSHERITGRVRTVHEERMREPLANGQGVVIALPHMANFDHAGGWAGLTGTPVASVAERLKPEGLFQKFLDYRAQLGITIYPLTGSDVNVMAKLAEHLQGGGLVCLPAERDLSQRGVPVKFFGEEARMPPGPAMLALRTGSVLLPLTLSYEGREPNHGIVLHFHEPVEVPHERANRITTMTQRVAEAFEEGIGRHPEDWHMTQRLFLADLKPDDPRRNELVAP